MLVHPVPALTLAEIHPQVVLACGVPLALAGLAVWASRRSGSRIRLLLLLLALLLAGRALLIHNPWAWQAYAAVLGAKDVGWRQRTVILTERQQFLRKNQDLRYLAVGSSQTEFLYQQYDRQNDDLEIFAMAGMFPLDFILYRHQIASFSPQTILLNLSEFDMSREHDPRRVVMAPSQRLGLVNLYTRLRQFPRGRDYDQAVLEMAMGEIFPEFKYGFVFRGLASKILEVAAGVAPAPREAAPDVAVGEEEMARQIEGLRGFIQPSSLDFNFAFLEDFLDFCSRRGIAVVIVEGQYLPAARTTRTEEVSRTVRARLQALAARPGVRYVAKEDIFEFHDEQYIDVAHVKRQAGQEYVSRLVELLEKQP